MSEHIMVDIQSRDCPIEIYENQSPEWKVLMVDTQRQYFSTYVAASLPRRETGRN
jgi:hypothetical protein